MLFLALLPLGLLTGSLFLGCTFDGLAALAFLLLLALTLASVFLSLEFRQSLLLCESGLAGGALFVLPLLLSAEC